MCFFRSHHDEVEVIVLRRAKTLVVFYLLKNWIEIFSICFHLLIDVFVFVRNKYDGILAFAITMLLEACDIPRRFLPQLWLPFLSWQAQDQCMPCPKTLLHIPQSSLPTSLLRGRTCTCRTWSLYPPRPCSVQ